MITDAQFASMLAPAETFSIAPALIDLSAEQVALFGCLSLKVRATAKATRIIDDRGQTLLASSELSKADAAGLVRLVNGLDSHPSKRKAIRALAMIAARCDRLNEQSAAPFLAELAVAARALQVLAAKL